MSEEVREPRRAFPTTRWPLLRDARAGRAAAVEALASRYWTAIVAWFQAEGRSAADAADLAQEFFVTHLLNPSRRARVIPDESTLHVRFRSFLKACLRNFGLNQVRAERAEKRGGGRQFAVAPEVLDRRPAPFGAGGPEQEFDRQWARELLRHAFDRLGIELDARALAALRAAVAGVDCRDTALRLGISEGAVAQIRHRARRRALRILCEEARRTLESATDLRAELRELADAIDEPGWLDAS